MQTGTESVRAKITLHGNHLKEEPMPGKNLLTHILITLVAVVMFTSLGAAQAASGSASGSKTAMSAKSTTLMDINSATADQLKTLPGIGDAIPRKSSPDAPTAPRPIW
jgi:DNA uptake protein ComE-like DNA-binding protein